jgi:hypothetical protein
MNEVEVDDIRLKEFRQLKKEMRGSKEYLIVGIDVAKEKHHAFFGTATGKTLDFPCLLHPESIFPGYWFSPH